MQSRALACGLGNPAEASRLADATARWLDHPNVRLRSYAVACPKVISAALDSATDLAGLRNVATYLGDEPAGVLRHDITRWNLYVADLLAERGKPALALPLTTRLGFVVEESAWLTPALLREAELSLAVGDTTRAALAYQRAARMLSDPEPALQSVAERVRRAAQTLGQATRRSTAPGN